MRFGGGFRTLHMYFPPSGVIIAIGLNSNAKPDHIHTLAAWILRALAASRSTA